jgi:hypothetical protein
MNELKLLVVEGPAGSGKTTLIREMLYAGVGQTPEIPFTIPRPRTYEGKVHLSMVKDHLSSYYALNYLNSERAVILDRWLISQLVYGSLRGETFIEQSTVSQIIDYGIDNLELAYRELQVRLGKPYPKAERLKLDVCFLMLLPSVEDLAMRRFTAKREFPYLEEEELTAYQMVSRLMPGRGLAKEIRSQTMNLSVRTLAGSSNQILRVAKSVTKEWSNAA